MVNRSNCSTASMTVRKAEERRGELTAVVVFVAIVVVVAAEVDSVVVVNAAYSSVAADGAGPLRQPA